MNLYKKCAATLAAAILSTALFAAGVTDHDARARQLVDKMTIDEKISLLSGETSFSIRAIPRLGIPRVLLADGPQGVRNHAPHSTLYPCGILTAASWDRDIARRVGESIGDDATWIEVSASCSDRVSTSIVPPCVAAIMNTWAKTLTSHRKLL